MKLFGGGVFLFIIHLPLVLSCLAYLCRLSMLELLKRMKKLEHSLHGINL